MPLKTNSDRKRVKNPIPKISAIVKFIPKISNYGLLKNKNTEKNMKMMRISVGPSRP